MKKRLFVFVLVVVALLASTTMAWALEGYVDDIPKDSHKVKNKWDLSGNFVSYPGYNWGSLSGGVTWNYDIHIKEAMYGEHSVGSIHFWTGDVDFVGQVKATKRFYKYWSHDNIAAVGTANYNDTKYYFMFIYADNATWLALSTMPFDSYWAAESVWGWSLRDYQVHSMVADGSFLLDYKMIH